MISIRGKKIRPEIISVWLNIVGFLASVIFYASIARNMGTPPVFVKNPLHDSLISINARLKADIATLQATEKSLLLSLKAKKEQLAQQQLQVNKATKKIYLNVYSSWDSLTKKEQEKYADQLIKKFKKLKKAKR